ncbi:MAG TPA: nicotinate (nicotinamide) nucleotide adenylyltransferase [Rhizomicrobium sp.]|nr:nicotinate (nicotinamide) nucleotide adenylyltransferase [Rhizomicrobium sp.]
MTKLERPHANWVRPPGPVAPGLKIGLLGGSFNPAHEGHVHVSEVALKRLGLDYVWWLVTPQNPLKSVHGMAPLVDRVTAARRVAHHPRIVVMDIEHDFRTHYSYDTLCALQTRFPQLKFTWLMGSDNLQIFRRWHRWADLAHRVPIAVIQRPGTVMAMRAAKPIQRFGQVRAERHFCTASTPAILVLEGRRNPQSATAIRAAQRFGDGFVGVLPA